MIIGVLIVKKINEKSIYYFNRKHHFFAERLLEILEVIEEGDYSSEVASLLMRSNRLLKNIMIYDEEWDMERCPTEFLLADQVSWEQSPNGDPEWMWMLNRHRFLISLVQSYAVTKEIKYIDQFINWITQWIDYHGNDIEKYRLTSCRTIDTGIRLRNWCVCFDVIFQLPELQVLFNDELLEKILGSMQSQVDFLMSEKNLSVASISNWKILEMNGVVVTTTLFPELAQSQAYRKKGLAYTNLAARLQINPDGMHWEQSFMYHHEVYQCLLDILLIGQRNNFRTEINFIDDLKQMLTVSVTLTKPDGSQSPVGDSDEEQMASLLTRGALVLKNGYAKYLGEKALSLDSLLYYGFSAISNYSVLVSQPPEKLKELLIQSGFVFLRNNWKKNGVFTMVKASPQGGGHGHCDIGHIEIQAGEDYLLSDSGRFTYLEGSQERKNFKKASSHNVATIDNKEFTEQDGSWTFKSVAHCLPLFTNFTSDVDYIETTHLGYENDGDRVLAQRKIYRINTGIWVIVDSFQTEEEHLFQQHFNFPSEKLEKISPKTFVYRGAEHNLFINMNLNRNSEVIVESGEYSPRYNERYANRKLLHQSSDRVLITILSLDRPVDVLNKTVYGLDNEKIAEEFVSVFAIHDQKTDYLIFNNHLEDQTEESRKIYQVDDKLAYGRAVLYQKQSNGKEKYTVLKS